MVTRPAHRCTPSPPGSAPASSISSVSFSIFASVALVSLSLTFGGYSRGMIPRAPLTYPDTAAFILSLNGFIASAANWAMLGPEPMPGTNFPPSTTRR